MASRVPLDLVVSCPSTLPPLLPRCFPPLLEYPLATNQQLALIISPTRSLLEDIPGVPTNKPSSLPSLVTRCARSRIPPQIVPPVSVTVPGSCGLLRRAIFDCDCAALYHHSLGRGASDSCTQHLAPLHDIPTLRKPPPTWFDTPSLPSSPLQHLLALPSPQSAPRTTTAPRTRPAARVRTFHQHHCERAANQAQYMATAV
jgi:hypothetical protein